MYLLKEENIGVTVKTKPEPNFGESYFKKRRVNAMNAFFGTAVTFTPFCGHLVNPYCVLI